MPVPVALELNPTFPIPLDEKLIDCPGTEGKAYVGLGTLSF